VPDQINAQDQKEKTEDGGKPTPSDNKRSADTSNRGKRKRNITTQRFRCWSLIFEGLLVLVGSIYSYYAWHQWSEMRLDRRAWVSVQRVKGFPEVGKPFRITVVLSNTGRTFAKHLKIVAAGDRFDSKQTPNFSAGIKESAKSRNPEMVSKCPPRS